MLHELAGQPAPSHILVDVGRLTDAYFARQPDVSTPAQLVSFGTSGHRGSSLLGSFNEAHILAITQAICKYRGQQGIDGPLFLGKDTHALSSPAERTVLEVLAANSVVTVMQREDGFTPTPAVSHAILTANRGKRSGLADGIVVTPSHNPPPDGGIKYNPPHGGPADNRVTDWIQERANRLLRDGTKGVRRLPYAAARNAATTRQEDLVGPYVADLASVVDMDLIRQARIRCGVDPLGGASLAYWQAIAERWRLDLEVVNQTVDPRFAFMTVDRDGEIRMDCSSPYAMAKLVELRGSYQVAFGNDPDSDRHGIVVPGAGLLNPNHYLAVAIRYLFARRTNWPKNAAVGKTLVSSAIIDRVVAELGRGLREVPVGFKWFVDDLLDGTIGFGGEESAGASFLRQDGNVWTTDKDGILLALLAAEITAATDKDPGQHYAEITAAHGSPLYTRIDRPATPAEKKKLKQLSPAQVRSSSLAGEPITAILTKAPGNGEPIGGLKVVAESGWFAARPSGTESVYKLYAESFGGKAHLDQIVSEASGIVATALAGPEPK
ncbi:MAG: alpha-D-glucose phosphate-specific phosphoglucomutase [Deltaproteobacteria bacterium]|nr:alpha-D-glucose phosphate-specific phosphoglucomutase [Deltaproteobacteria bacterium]